MSLAHYKNSKASSKWEEPMYPNLFEVTILPPSTVRGGELLLEHVQKISGIETDKGSAVVEQKYKWATRSYASGVPESTITEPTIDFTLNLNDANELYIYKTLKNWWRIAWNPLTGEQGLKKDYRGTIIVSCFNRKGDIFWTRTFNDCIPNGNLPEISLDYSSGEPVEFSGVKWRSDWWTENEV